MNKRENRDRKKKEKKKREKIKREKLIEKAERTESREKLERK